MGQNASTPFESGSSFSPESGVSGSGAFYRGRRAARPLSTLSSTSSSYFPSLSKRSSVSSVSSSVESPSSSTSTSNSSRASTPGAIIGNYPLPALDREYAKPEGELDVAKQLAKKPAYWSAQGWVHRAAAAGAAEPGPRAEDPEVRARKFAEAKRELLASAGRL